MGNFYEPAAAAAAAEGERALAREKLLMGSVQLFKGRLAESQARARRGEASELHKQTGN